MTTMTSTSSLRPTQRRADPAAVAEAAQSMSDAVVECRDFGHSWRPHTASWVAKIRGYERTRRCSRCRTFNDQVLDSVGRVVKSSMRYPDGYLLKGLGRVTGDGKAAIRLASVTRYIERKAG